MIERARTVDPTSFWYASAASAMSVQLIASTVIASRRSSPPTGVVGYIALGKAMRIAVPTAEPIAATSSASATMQDCGFFASVSN